MAMRLIDVAMREVAEFVREDGFDFGGSQAGEQGVEEDDALVVLPKPVK